MMDCIAEMVGADQYGCMKKTGTVQTLMNLVHNWRTARDKLHTFVRVLLLDFRKGI